MMTADPKMRRLILCALVAALAALVGPRLIGPQSHSAGTPFVYEPPEGFVPIREAKPEAEGAQVWGFETVDPPKSGAPFAATPTKTVVARTVLTHSTKEMSVEERDLAKLAEEMPKAFEGICTWVHRRHEMRVRSDGARVGLIEGDCQRDVDLGALGLPSQQIKMRKLQLMFPDDGGTQIVTASFPIDQASRWEPLIEATIGKAKGVAVRVPAPPPWLYVAWGAAGAVLGFLLSTILFRTRDKSDKPQS
jgi:hypothetical protein